MPVAGLYLSQSRTASIQEEKQNILYVGHQLCNPCLLGLANQNFSTIYLLHNKLSPSLDNSPISIIGQLTHLHHWSTHPCPSLVNSPISIIAQLTHLHHWSTYPSPSLVFSPISTIGQLTHPYHWSTYPSPSSLNSPISIITQLTHLLCSAEPCQK